MFRLKTAEEITQKMLDWTNSQTDKLKDFNVGSKVRTLYEAYALVLEEYYYRVFEGLKDLIEENIYNVFNFGIVEAKESVGTVTFYRDDAATQAYNIPVGTILTTKSNDQQDAVFFRTTEAAELSIGEVAVNVAVICERVGVIGNVSVGVITEMITKPSGIDYVTNAESFFSGREQETRDTRKKRFNQYIMSLFKATKEALLFGANKTDGVVDASIVESPRAILFATDELNNLSDSVNDPYSDTNPTVFKTLVPQTGDFFYVGGLDKFYMFYMNIQQPSVNPILGVWEYYNGENWVTIPDIIDGTNSFRQSGTIRFPKLLDWRIAIVDFNSFFAVRFTVETSGGNNIRLKNLFLSPPPGYVDLYIMDSNGNAPEALIDDAIINVEPFRGAGITVNIKEPTKINFPIQTRVVFFPNVSNSEREDIAQQIRGLILQKTNSLRLGETLFIKEVRDSLFLDDFAVFVRWIDIESPQNNVIVSKGDVIRLSPEDVIITVVD